MSTAFRVQVSPTQLDDVGVTVVLVEETVLVIDQAVDAGFVTVADVLHHAVSELNALARLASDIRGISSRVFNNNEMAQQ